MLELCRWNWFNLFYYQVFRWHTIGPTFYMPFTGQGDALVYKFGILFTCSLVHHFVTWREATFLSLSIPSYSGQLARRLYPEVMTIDLLYVTWQWIPRRYKELHVSKIPLGIYFDFGMLDFCLFRASLVRRRYEIVRDIWRFFFWSCFSIGSVELLRHTMR